jgi:predicted nucleic-acid-binding Zn-ribbon protein
MGDEDDTMIEQQCPECNGTEFYSKEVAAVGGCGPDLLPGTGHVFAPGMFRLCVCGQCGYVKWFVPERLLDNIKTKGKFQKMT